MIIYLLLVGSSVPATVCLRVLHALRRLASLPLAMSQAHWFARYTGMIASHSRSQPWAPDVVEKHRCKVVLSKGKGAPYAQLLVESGLVVLL